jgi:hypothetical protein
MLSTMAYSIQNIINFQKKVSNSKILSTQLRSIKDSSTGYTNNCKLIQGVFLHDSMKKLEQICI